MTNECVFLCCRCEFVCAGLLMGGRRGEKGWGGGDRRGRLLQRLSDVLHVSQAMCQGQLWSCAERLHLYGSVSFCLPDETSFELSSTLPQISVGDVNGMEYKSRATQSMSTALLLLNKSQAITGYNPFQILRLCRGCSCYSFKNSPAVPHFFFFDFSAGNAALS